MVGGSATTSFRPGTKDVRLMVALTEGALRLAPLGEPVRAREWPRFPRSAPAGLNPDGIQLLLGAWVGAAPDEPLRFDADGTMLYRDQSWHFLVLDGGRLRVISTSGTWATWRHSIDGDRLVLGTLDEAPRLAGPTMNCLEIHRAD